WPPGRRAGGTRARRGPGRAPPPGVLAVAVSAHRVGDHDQRTGDVVVPRSSIPATARPPGASPARGPHDARSTVTPA
ncbi:MAG: hypothetical protein AVDCRST_MAG66-4420, partial [uncultured Pseudonocardia sp.]